MRQLIQGSLFPLEDKWKFILVRIPKMWIDKDGEPMMSFRFKGAEAGWATAKRHTNECVPGVIVLLSTHTMWPFIARSSVSLCTCCPRLWKEGQALNPPPAVWPWVSAGSAPVREVGAELVPTSQSHFANTVRWRIRKYPKEAGAHARFPWALPPRLWVPFQRLTAASCHSSCHREGYCTAPAGRPYTFLPTHF